MAKKTVMIIEDDLLHMKLFHDVLESQGYETIRCPDGEDVLEIALGQRPDLVLLDICLPLISGFDIVKELRSQKEFKNTPIIAVTAISDNYEEVDYLLKGFDGFISKPITIPNFLHTIAGFIDPLPVPIRQIA